MTKKATKTTPMIGSSAVVEWLCEPVKSTMAPSLFMFVLRVNAVP
jgi:hypothetical protein